MKLRKMTTFILVCISIIGCMLMNGCDMNREAGLSGSLSLDQIPQYSGSPYTEINGNRPSFDEKLLRAKSFEEYGKLDSRGRCTVALACLSDDTQPADDEVRGDISQVTPSGWQDNGYWERCHLIGWQLCAENDNSRNLITGSHYMNVTGMLPFENQVDLYIETTGNHVLYRVTPIYQGNEPVARGVEMEAYSIEDKGRGVSFHIFCYNVEPGYEIHYGTGEVKAASGNDAHQQIQEYVLNTSSMRIHLPECSSVSTMAEHNKKAVKDSIEHLESRGYVPCGACRP